MKTKTIIWLFLSAALIASGFFAINASDEAARSAGRTYFFMTLAAVGMWLLAIQLRIFGRGK